MLTFWFHLQKQGSQDQRVVENMIFGEKTSKHEKFFPNIKTNFSPHLKEHRGSEQCSTTVFKTIFSSNVYYNSLDFIVNSFVFSKLSDQSSFSKQSSVVPSHRLELQKCCRELSSTWSGRWRKPGGRQSLSSALCRWKNECINFWYTTHQPYT